MTKILLMSNGYPSKSHPNYLSFVKNINDCLIEAGCEVDLLVMDTKFDNAFQNYLQYINYYIKALFFNRYKQYDYIYINMYPWCFLPLIPHFHNMKHVVIHWHGDDILPPTLLVSILNWVSYKFLRNTFIHFSPSKYFANQVAEKLKINIEKIIVSPSGGIDMEIFKEKIGKVKTANLIRLGFASALLKLKGADLILKLLENIKSIEEKIHCKIEIHFIEYGKEKQKYSELLSQFQNTVKHSPYPVFRMAEFYHQIDILLFPSLSESLGLAALEAMSCNIPVVATDACAFQETVMNGISGERFKINDFNDFQKAIINCIQNIDKYSPRNFIEERYSKKSVVEHNKIFFK